MTYFDENGPYWGNQITPLVGTPDDRLTARSVKIFADGEAIMRHSVESSAYFSGFRCAEDWWCGCTFRPSPLPVSRLLINDNRKLYEPYADNPSTSGQMRLPDHVFHEVIPQFLKDGWQVVRAPFPEIYSTDLPLRTSTRLATAPMALF